MSQVTSAPVDDPGADWPSLGKVTVQLQGRSVVSSVSNGQDPLDVPPSRKVKGVRVYKGSRRGRSLCLYPVSVREGEESPRPGFHGEGLIRPVRSASCSPVTSETPYRRRRCGGTGCICRTLLRPYIQN